MNFFQAFDVLPFMGAFGPLVNGRIASVNRAATSILVVLLLLLGMVAIEPAEARRGGHRRVGGRIGGRSVMRGAGRMSRGVTRGLLGGRRGHGGRGRRNRNNMQGQNTDPNGLYNNGANGAYHNGAYNNGANTGNHFGN